MYCRRQKKNRFLFYVRHLLQSTKFTLHSDSHRRRRRFRLARFEHCPPRRASPRGQGLRLRVPKESPRDVKEEQTTQRLQEEIAAAESMFSLIGGLRANPKGIISWLFGSHNTFAFEVVAYQKLISFYVAVPKKMRRFVEQEIYAHYPAASIETVADYNIFSPQSHTKAAALVLKRANMFALRTYRKMDIDPQDSIINTLAKLNENEGAAIQIIARSAPKAWRARGMRVTRAVRQGKTLTEALRATSYSRFFGGAGKMSEIILQKQKNEQPPERQQMTPVEEESLRSIEEKMSKAGLLCNLRVIVASPNSGQAQIYLDNIVDAFNQYTVFEYGNGLKPVRRLKAAISSMILSFATSASAP